MSFVEAISLAAASLRANKLRSLLTLLGVIIGIAAVVAIVTLSQGLRVLTTEGIFSVGANDVHVQVIDRVDEEDLRRSSTQFNFGGPEEVEVPITPQMLEQLRSAFGNRIDGIDISPGSTTNGTVTVLPQGGVEVGVNIIGTDPDSLRLNAIEVSTGRLLTEKDIDSDSNVAIIGAELLRTQFGGDPARAIGSEILVDFSPTETAAYVVVGVEQPAANTFFGESLEKKVWVPYPSLIGAVENVGEWRQVDIRPSNEALGVSEGKPVAPGALPAFKQELKSWLDQFYEGTSNDLELYDFSSDFRSFDNVMNQLSLGLAGIAGISLLVGGIGVMNIMLVSVTERTREIGVRKAMGARNRDIRVQFVVEAMIISLLGGAIGLVLGWVVGSIGAHMLGAGVQPPITGMVVSAGFSLMIGLFFGYYPANRAAKLNPIEALRYE